MAIEITVPTLGESVADATVARWIKTTGDAVKADEPVVELETDKVTLEVPAPASGTLGEILAAEGDTVEVRYRGRKRYYPGKISRDCGEGKYDIAYDDGEDEKRVDARLIRRLPRSPLDIAQENGHAAVVALLEEHQK